MFSVSQNCPKCLRNKNLQAQKKPRNLMATGLSNMEAEAGIEPAWADLQSAA